tara:strand:- start:745 stop:1497 length:753 start_codon:yes stop_codon:yes gene_type:complete
MRRKFLLNKEIKKLFSSKKFYIKFNRAKKIRYEKNYHSLVKDPDGKLRDLTKERKFKLKQMSYVLSFLKKRGGKILDVGCGHGWMLSALGNQWRKHGVEISKFASRTASKYCDVYVGEIDFYKEKKFNVITALHIIEHHRKPEYFLKLIKSKLVSKGILILETPDFDSAAARKFGNNFRLLKDKTHVSLFSQDSLIRFVRSYGFEVIDINYPYFETPFFNKKNLLRMFDSKKKISPPFYGSTITLFLRKK